MAGASRYDYLDHAISCKHCEEGFYWPPGADKGAIVRPLLAFNP